jgi:putative ABC transport system permease protein
MLTGILLFSCGLSCAVVTMTAFTGSEPALMAVGGQGAILSAIGLALLAPAIISGTARLAGPLRRAGVGGYLTVHNLRGRTRPFADALAPIILFTAIATGTLYMQRIENAATAAPPASIAETIETMNYVVVGMIALFTAVLLVNTLITSTVHRRREFGQLRLIGSTIPQVLRLVSVEGGVLSTIGIMLGTAAATVTVVPYSIVKTGSPIPDTTIGVYLGIIALAAVLTLATSIVAARTATRSPAIEAIAAA